MAGGKTTREWATDHLLELARLPRDGSVRYTLSEATPFAEDIPS